MRCLFGLHGECRVVKVICENDAFKQRCIELTAEYGSEKFIKTYCSMCIKSVYAKAKKHIRMTVVNTL
jgi:hypothetical protein